MSLSSTHPASFLKQSDHIAIQTDDSAAPYHSFKGVFKLPPFVPLIDSPTLTSASVLLGNMYLEFLRFGPQPTRLSLDLITARLYVLSFVTSHLSLAESLAKLDQRGMAHSGVLPFYRFSKQDEPPEKIWANVYLDDLLGKMSWMRPLFPLEQIHARPAYPGIPGSVTFIAQRVFPTGWPVPDGVLPRQR